MDKLLTAAETAFDILDDADVLHEFDDSVTLRVDRELWLQYLQEQSAACIRNGHRDDGRGCCVDCGEFI